MKQTRQENYRERWREKERREIYAYSPIHTQTHTHKARHNKAKELNAKSVCSTVFVFAQTSAYVVPTMPYISSTNYAKNFTAFAFSTELIIYVMYVNRFLSIPFCSVVSRFFFALLILSWNA